MLVGSVNNISGKWPIYYEIALIFKQFDAEFIES